MPQNITLAFNTTLSLACCSHTVLLFMDDKYFAYVLPYVIITLALILSTLRLISVQYYGNRYLITVYACMSTKQQIPHACSG